MQEQATRVLFKHATIFGIVEGKQADGKTDVVRRFNALVGEEYDLPPTLAEDLHEQGLCAVFGPAGLIPAPELAPATQVHLTPPRSPNDAFGLTPVDEVAAETPAPPEPAPEPVRARQGPPLYGLKRFVV